MIHLSKNTLHIKYFNIMLLLIVTAFMANKGWAQAEPAREEDYFKIMRVPAPEGVKLEVGGLCTLPDGDLGVCTRRGDVFIVENPTSQHPYFRKFASGLHEPLGLAYKDGAFYCSQRGELTKLVDSNMDGKADIYETIYAWPLSGNYCEYNYLEQAPDGSFFVSCNLAFPIVDWWRPTSPVPWRGWMLHIFPDGRMEPWAAGMRSPAGLGMIDGQIFYGDNQGDWIGSGGIMPVKKGAFTGHPASLRWTNMPNSPIRLTQDQIFEKVNPRIRKDAEGNDIKPENIVNEKFMTLFELKKSIPEIQLPSVWLPYGILGVSNSEIVKIPDGTFGPFEGQLLVGDEGQSMISRVFLEKVNGEYQGAAWAFRSGFQSGVLRLAWSKDGSLFVGETNRGWGSAGDATEGLQRLVWNNHIPFEMRAIKAMPDGFEIEFTKPVDKKYAEDISSYSVESFIYKYQPSYGSPQVNIQKCPITGVKVSEDRMKARITVNNMRRYYIHTITLEGIRDEENHFSLVHPTAYYTLNNIPEGKKLSLNEVSTKNSAKSTESKTKAKKATTAKVPTYAIVKPLLLKNTCLACHNQNIRQVGPAYIDVAKRGYTVEQIIQLIHNPKPKHWPDYATPMPPMPQVPKEEARKIAEWINSLENTK